MRRGIHVDQRVRLTRDIPEISLRRGDSGIVRSVWFAPDDSYEVEFERPGSDFPQRCLLTFKHVEPETMGDELADARLSAQDLS